MSYKFSVRTVSSLEACFLDDKITSKPEKKSFVMYRNEKLSFQVICSCDEWNNKEAAFCNLTVDGELSAYVKIREVVCVPNHYPVCPQNFDDNYMRTEPGLYPNLLRPLMYKGCYGSENGCMRMPVGQLRSFWIDVEIPNEASISYNNSDLCFALNILSRDNKATEVASSVVSIRVSELCLPEQRLIHTEWFYCDCIAEAYHTKAFSTRHWKMIEKYMKTAVNNGINMIMMPVFTQELDTYIGGERMTTQLVKITVENDGKYTFDFALVDKWIDLCLKVGVKYFEIPHFFTQWGADHAPKIVATVKGRVKRIFGWETDSQGEEYAAFLSAFIPALVEHFKKRGIDKRCYYHISDEPSLAQIDKYTACKKLIAPHVKGYNIIDALSSFEFYEKGVLDKPVCSITHSEKFLEHKIPGLWVYYCGAGGKTQTTDRYLSMPMARTRILGVQLFANKIEGFLHWGYNFYHNFRSYEYVDILSCNDGEYFAPSGDMCLVYPGLDGEVWESMRLNAMREAMDDIRALDLYESMFGREAAERIINENLSKPLTFFDYPRDSDYLLSLHDKVLLSLEEGKVGK